MKWVLVWILAGNPTPVIPYIAHSEASCKAAGAALSERQAKSKGAWLCARLLADIEIEPIFQWTPPLTPTRLEDEL